MKSVRMKAFVFLVVCCVSLAAYASPQLTALTYTGFLKQNGAPVTGHRNLAFQLFDADTGGNPVGSTITADDYPVDNGIFIIDLDFPDAFAGEQRWIQVLVDGEPLSPRKAVTATPVAQYALTGNPGPPGPPGPPGTPGSLSCKTMVSRYPAGVFELQCPSGYTAMSASCDLGLSLVIADATRPLPPGTTRWVWYLIPSADNATGVHCELMGNPASTSSEASVRCCRL